MIIVFYNEDLPGIRFSNVGIWKTDYFGKIWLISFQKFAFLEIFFDHRIE